VGSLAVSLRTPGGTTLIDADILAKGETVALRAGRNELSIQIEDLPLNPGVYVAGLWAGHAFGAAYDHLESAFEVEVVPARVEGLDRVFTPGGGLVPCRFGVLTGGEGEAARRAAGGGGWSR